MVEPDARKVSCIGQIDHSMSARQLTFLDLVSTPDTCLRFVLSTGFGSDRGFFCSGPSSSAEDRGRGAIDDGGKGGFVDLG